MQLKSPERPIEVSPTPHPEALFAQQRASKDGRQAPLGPPSSFETRPAGAPQDEGDRSGSEPDASAAGSLPLLLWLSPAFPVGSYAYSHGLEWAVEAGDVRDAKTLAAWLEDLLSHGAPRSDAVLFCRAHRAARANEWRALDAINDLAIALCGSAERRLETFAQGAAFLAAMRAAWACEAFAHWPQAPDAPVAYPVAVALATAGHGLSLKASLPAYMLAFQANLVSAAIRLGAIGQTDGQRILAHLTPLVRRQAEALENASLDDLGGCALRADIAAMRHETQYSRLFRS